MANICELPDEILLDVLEYVRVSSTGGLLKAMLSCRTLCRVAATLVYSRVRLRIKLRDDCDTSRFARCVQRSNSDLVQSLSLQFSQVYLMGLSIRSAESAERFQELQSILPRLESLQSFSLYLEKPSGQSLFSIPTSVIVGVLKDLPRTVVNLDLHCESLYYPAISQPHLCATVSALMPRLRRLRLRLSHICESFLASLGTNTEAGAPALALEDIIIRLDLPPYAQLGTKTHRCYTGGDPIQGHELAISLKLLHEHGKLPYLRRCVIIERLDAMQDPLGRNENWNVFKVRELTKDTATTTTFPWRARGGSSSLYMIRDIQGDWFGSFDDISRSLEGNLIDTVAGIHRMRKSKRASNIWTLDHERLASRQSVTQKFGVALRLWKHEESTGMKLLDVRTTADFEDTAGVAETVPSGWAWVPGGPWGWTIAPIAA